MSRLGYVFIFSITILHANGAERRILAGRPSTVDRGYVVYLIKATTETQYDAWMCGGAIATPSLIVTSAACVEDVKHIYAIAGYLKYVKYEELNTDMCTREKKKKIVYVCIPSAYNFDYPKIEDWANIDVAVVKVESPYDFSDGSYKSSCSYIPTSIEINYDPKYEQPGTDGVVFGWGHTHKWRSISDAKDYNEATLRYGSVRLADKEECKIEYEPPVQTIIEKYMVCSIKEGNLDEQGGLINDKIDRTKLVTECGPGTKLLGRSCLRDNDFYRRNNANATDNVNITSRRSGICQNDHGGPLITWRGPKEILIGLASVFRVEKGSNNCIPPFLYTSTYCNSKFLHCLLNEDEHEKENIPGPSRRSFDYSQCLKPPKELGYHVIRRTISWFGHPDGPALNELYDGINIQKRENVSSQTQNNQRKPESKDDDKKPETQHSIETLPPTIGEKKSETKLVGNQGGNVEGSDDDVIKFSDILQSHQEENSTDVKKQNK